jgi:hypothetical protein
MSFTTDNNGRLGNQIIRNIATNFICKKFDLYVMYSNDNLIKQLGINLFCGNKKYDNFIILTDDNYFDILNCDKLELNLYPNNNYFQTKPILNLIFEYLHNEDNKKNIIDINPYNDRYKNNDDIFIHIRLGDVIKFNPGLEYYKISIEKIRENNDVNNIYISTDSPEHDIVKYILQNYNAYLFNKNEIETIQFGSTCKFIILSHGSFSSTIGYLGFFSQIYHKKMNIIQWCPDMSRDDWNQIE